MKNGADVWKMEELKQPIQYIELYGVTREYNLIINNILLGTLMNLSKSNRVDCKIYLSNIGNYEDINKYYDLKKVNLQKIKLEIENIIRSTILYEIKRHDIILKILEKLNGDKNDTK